MQVMFTEFKDRLRLLRRIAEASSTLNMSEIKSSLDKESFYDRVILYRLEEYEQAQPFTKQSFLRFLSLWECSL